MSGFASRFCVLKIDDDSDEKSSDEGPVKNKNAKAKPGASTQAAKKKNRRKKAADEKAQAAELQALAFGKPKKFRPKGKAPGPSGTEEQWEEWKEKDEAIVSEAFETDMAQAILLSKIDYEQNRNQYDKAANDKGGKKVPKKGIKTVSLDAFQQMSPNQVERLSAGLSKDEGDPKRAHGALKEKDPAYFERVNEETREELMREHRRRLLMERPRLPSSESGVVVGEKSSSRSPPPAESPVESGDSSSEEDERVQVLEAKLKDEKEKSKKLLQLFKIADMKEKAQLVIEADRANHVAGELTAQVAELHGQLEQERSKVHTLTDEIKKLQEQLHRKRTTSENQ